MGPIRWGSPAARSCRCSPSSGPWRAGRRTSRGSPPPASKLSLRRSRRNVLSGRALLLLLPSAFGLTRVFSRARSGVEDRGGCRGAPPVGSGAAASGQGSPSWTGTSSCVTPSGAAWSRLPPTSRSGPRCRRLVVWGGDVTFGGTGPSRATSSFSAATSRGVPGKSSARLRAGLDPVTATPLSVGDRARAPGPGALSPCRMGTPSSRPRGVARDRGRAHSLLRLFPGACRRSSRSDWTGALLRGRSGCH